MIIVGHPDKTVSKGDIFNETLAVRKHINGGPRIWADFVGDWSDMSEGTHASRGDRGSANMARSAHTGRTGIIRVKVRKGRIRTVILREVQWGERIGVGGGGTTTRGEERFANNGEAGGNQTTCSKVVMIAAMNGAFELLHSRGLGGIEGSRPNPCDW